MFWGLILEPSRRYTQTVSKPFHITMAAMDETTSNDGPTQVILTYQERNYLLCTLKKGEIVNVPLDLTFDTDDHISFASNGNAHIHLTGYLVEEEESPFDSGSEEEEEAEEAVPVGSKRKLQENGAQPKKKSKTLELLEDVASDDESDDETVHLSDLSELDTTMGDDDDTSDEDDDEAEDGEEEEDDDEDLEEEEDDDEDIEEEELEEPAPQKTKLNGKAAKDQKPDKKTTKQKQDKATKVEKSPQKQQQSPKKENTSPKKEPGSPAKKTLENGVVVEDLTVGQGPAAKFGKVVKVYYEGRLKSNNKMFDSSKKGPGFEFRLGRKEVIKGWDVGVQGMKVGGKRRITCPPNMAYGSKGSPPVIPPNATLVFEVELKKVL